MDAWIDVPPGSWVSSLTKVVPDGTVLYHHVKATNRVGLASIATSDGLLMDSRPPPRGDVADGLDQALGQYQAAPHNGTGWDLDFHSSRDTLSGRWRAFGALELADAAAVPARFRPRLPRIEVGLSTTKALPPAGVPDVVGWVACDPGPSPVPAPAGCEAVPAAALAQWLAACANETALLDRGWDPARDNCTCFDAVLAYRRSCFYQGLSGTDPTRQLVDDLTAVCAPEADCVPWDAHGNFTARNLTLASHATYYVLVRATAQSGMDVVVVSDGLTVDDTPPALGWLEFTSLVTPARTFGLTAYWGGWVDAGRLHHFEVCLGPADVPCGSYVDVGLSSARYYELPPVWEPVVHQICVQAFDYVRLSARKCMQVAPISAGVFVICGYLHLLHCRRRGWGGFFPAARVLQVFLGWSVWPLAVHRGPNSYRDGPNSDEHGPNSYRDGPNSDEHGPNSYRDGPNSDEHGPNSYRDGPNSDEHGPNSYRDGPNSDEHGPNSYRDGPSFDEHGPKSYRGDPNP